jgi:hypothetical protein
MFDTIVTSGVIAPVATTANVVSHDNSSTASTQVITLTPYQSLENLIVQRQVWEDEVFRASNDRLYSILQDCYALYVKASSKTDAKALNEALALQANTKGLSFKASAHTLTKIVKCVFGADRRRASAYSIALRTAHTDRVKPDDLPQYIRERGGVEEIRLAKSNALKPAEKAAKAADFVNNTELAVLQTPAVTALLDTAKVDEFVVLVAQQGADGTLTIKAVVDSKTVVDAALASVYSTNSAVIKNNTAEQAVVTESIVAEIAIGSAVQSVIAA